MTYEEILTTCKMKCTECQEIFHNICDKENCVTETVRKIVEKQIPHKCKMFKDKCICGYTVFPHMEYCTRCGQRLDWSELNDKRKFTRILRF